MVISKSHNSIIILDSILRSLKGSELSVYASSFNFPMHSIRVVPLPGNPRCYNSYLHKVHAVAGSSNHGIYSPAIPAAQGREAVPRRELSTNVIFDLDERPDHIPEQQWNALSGFVYNALYLGCPDHMKHFFFSCPPG